MIGPALVALLKADPTLSNLVGERITPARFEQGGTLPCLVYGTDTIKPLNCRGAHNSYMGTLEIGIMTLTYPAMQAIVLALRRALDNCQVSSGNVAFSAEPGQEKPDESTSDATAFYKQIDFEVYVTLS